MEQKIQSCLLNTNMTRFGREAVIGPAKMRKEWRVKSKMMRAPKQVWKVKQLKVQQVTGTSQRVGRSGFPKE